MTSAQVSARRSEEVDEYLCRVMRLQEWDWQKQERNPPDFVIESRKKLEGCRKTLWYQDRIAFIPF